MRRGRGEEGDRRGTEGGGRVTGWFERQDYRSNGTDLETDRRTLTKWFISRLNRGDLRNI